MNVGDFLIGAAWVFSGVFCLLQWKFTEDEVTLLDVVAGVLLGAVFGPVVPLIQGMYAVKIKGGKK